ALRIMSNFPGSQAFLRLGFLPEIAKLISLPPIADLNISARFKDSWQISAQTFFKLLITHANLHLPNIEISPDEWTESIEILSADLRKRRVTLLNRPSTVISWLKHHGIMESSEPGAFCGEFKITCSLDRQTDCGTIQLRYKNCHIVCTSFSWTGGSYLTSVCITNEQE
ncbi:hypothetical protein PENTCL1PPCAC_20498, partial [Pristionchus entomophagus]